jgi:hypothetical protein
MLVLAMGEPGISSPFVGFFAEILFRVVVKAISLLAN